MTEKTAGRASPLAGRRVLLPEGGRAYGLPFSFY